MKNLIGLVLVGLLATQCAPPQNVRGPRLVGEVALTVTPAPDGTPLITDALAFPAPVSPEAPPLLALPTTDADVVLVTPTLPPSKTPTRTPTLTLTATQTLTPTITTTSTATAFALPTSVISPLNGVVAVPNNQICDSNWFFLQPRPLSCPMNIPNASNGVYQTFQNGTMIWVGSQDAIYVLYNDTGNPRWQVFRDMFEEGMAENSGQFASPSSDVFQPRRGFGMLWRSNDSVRNRIGWGIMRDELPYSVQVQTARDGTIYVSAPNQTLFGLLPYSVGWGVYNTTAALNEALFGTPIIVPLPTVLGN